MGAHHKSRFWRICRLYFRGFRIVVWLLILTALAGLIYVNQIGLPDVVKRPLLDKLRARGLDLQFSRLRVSWNQGVVAENVHFGPADQEISPHLNVAEVQVRLNWKALAHLRIQVDSLMLRQGRLSWTLLETNRAPQELTVAGIQTDLRFLSEDEWSLDNFKAQFAGAKIQLSGVVTNASAVRDWRIFQGQQPLSVSAKLWQRRLRSLSDTLEHIHFSEAPGLRVNVRGDALDLHTFNVLLSLSAPGAETPWGAVSQGRFAARLFSTDTNGLSRAELDIHAADARTRWAAITNFSLNIRLSSLESQTNLVNGELKLSAAQVQTQWANGSNALFTATWIHSITNPIPLSGQGRISCDFAQTSWGSASNIDLSGDLAPASAQPSIPDPSWAWWTNLQPYRLSWDCRLLNLQSPKLVANQIMCAGIWQPPFLTVTNLNATLFEGQLAAQADLDVASRAARLSLTSDFDPHRLAALLPESGQRFLDQLSWPKAPQINGDLSVTLPAWTNPAPDWRAEVQPTLQLQGEINFMEGGSYRQVQASSARSHFTYSNLCWHLPDLTLIRPEGRLQAEHRANDTTKDFYWRLSSTLDPAILRPLLDRPAQQALDLFTFSQPPALDVQIWGRSHDSDRTGLLGQVALSNFTFRGQAITWLQTDVQYTNRFLRFADPRVQVADRNVQADGLAVDLNAQLIYLTNGLSNADPMMIARVIGPHIVRAIEAYRFSSPPDARVYGTIPLHGEESADLHFELKGGPFQWWKFNIPYITGNVHWSGLHLSLANVQADFYHGNAVGWAAFDFPPERGTEFQFAVNATNVLLQALMADLSPHTNHLEGRLYGTLAVTKADADNWQTVFGHGDAHLRDGLIWDIPLFGIFSPVLNGIIPGLGNSRASAATSSFIITNGVIRTGDLEIRSTAMRLEYRGTVNLEGQINARVDAELLRDMWLVGPLVSTVFWPVTKLFEYRVTGNLADPKTEPVFIIPKIMLLPFRPFRTLKGLTPEDPNTSPNFSPLPP
jgi:AsmA-like protein